MICRKLIVFDLDGTLIDSRADLTTAVNLMRAEYDLDPLSKATVTAYVGNGLRRLVERALGDAAPGIDVDSAIESTRTQYAAHMLDQTVLYPGVRDALTDILELGFAMAVVTNKPEAPTRAICRHLDVERFFETLIGGDTCASLKPDAEPLRLAMQRTGTTEQGAWIVGDNHTDMAAGRNAGIARCFCRYGFGTLSGESHDLAIDSLGEFAAHIADCLPASSPSR